MNEIWIPWEPLPNLKIHYNIASVTDNHKGFEVILKPMNATDKAVRIVWVDAESYRLISESYSFFTTPVDAEGQVIPSWCFFKVENSKYLQWFTETAGGMVEFWGRTFIHYSIIADDAIFDVITHFEPIVEYVDVTDAP